MSGSKHTKYGGGGPNEATDKKLSVSIRNDENAYDHALNHMCNLPTVKYFFLIIAISVQYYHNLNNVVLNTFLLIDNVFKHPS